MFLIRPWIQGRVVSSAGLNGDFEVIPFNTLLLTSGDHIEIEATAIRGYRENTIFFGY